MQLYSHHHLHLLLLLLLILSYVLFQKGFLTKALHAVLE
jgi:hypothetical protein